MSAIQSGQSEGTVETVPSGIAVYYQSRPKRLYRITTDSPGMLSQLELEADAQAESNQLCIWREVPSVTTVLDVLNKPALPWWGMKVGIEGCQELMRRDGWLPGDVDTAIALLTEGKLTVNHVRDKAGDRGQSVHDAFEAWARTGHKPDPQIYPDEERGYIGGLLAFLADVPSIEPIACEVLVASVEHGYAGRYDLRCATHSEHEVVVHKTKTKTVKKLMAPGVILCDLKTSRNAYETHALQLAAYEQASIESGYGTTSARGILLVDAEGGYRFKRASADIEDFLAVLNVYQRMSAGKGVWL